MPLTILPGIIQLAMSPPADTCMAPRIAASILPPRIMPNEVAESKKRGAAAHRHGLLAGVDQVGVDLVVGRVGADAEDAVLGLQHDLDVVGHVVGHEGRQADAEVDVRAVVELGGGAGGHLLAGQGHAQDSSRSRRHGALLDALVGGLLGGQRHAPAARRCRAGARRRGRARRARRAPRPRRSSTRPAIAASGLKLRAALVEHQVAVAVALPGAHQREVGDDRLLEHVLALVAVGSNSRISFGGEASATLPSAA